MAPANVLNKRQSTVLAAKTALFQTENKSNKQHKHHKHYRDH